MHTKILQKYKRPQHHPDDGRVDWKSQPEGSNLKSQVILPPLPRSRPATLPATSPTRPTHPSDCFKFEI
ncbi:hypothetical protein KFK09_012898 [Dendrobium nobile]|uniref:Uncharacterized protein n=1 Tax=Dendrobium nobile TaxID=94219 RepID=A0A8T3BJ22_DENNO|nr:hypothetical protein KFK09_012898 [Dendrobium nobile]